MSDPSDKLVRDLQRAFDPEETALAGRSLRQFIESAWHVVEPGTRFVPGWHLDAIVEHLEAVTRGQVRNLLINCPPRHMKSLTVCVFWPVWEWIAVPQRRWLFASYALSLSVRDSLKCRRLINSPWFQSRWGDCFSLCDDQDAKHRFENTKTGCRIATSVGGAATGEGGDRVVVDDPHNVIDRESEAVRRAALVWWDETMSTRLNDPKTGAKVIVMQRLHERDLSGHVLEQGGYVHLLLPAEFEPSRRCTTAIGWTDPRKREGELLWPKRVGKKEIADFKLRLGPDGYAGQFQQRPAPAGGARFRSEWFRYYSGHTGTISDAIGPGSANSQRASHPSNVFADSPLTDDGAECDDTSPEIAPGSPGDSHATAGHPTVYHLHQPVGPPKLVRADDCLRFASMDPAGTEPTGDNRPCYTVIQIWDVTPTGDMLLVHQYREQVQTPDAANAAVRLCRRFAVEFIAIEKDGLGLGIVQAVRNRRITVRAVKAHKSKESRSQTAEIRMAAGGIYFPSQAPFLFDLEKELLQFPKSEHSDQADALAHAAILVHRMGLADAGEMEKPEPRQVENEETEDAWGPV